MTTVVNVRTLTLAALDDPNFVYVGRRCAGWPASDFGNPFKPDRGSLVYVGKAPAWTADTKRVAVIQCVARFSAYLETAVGEPWETMRRRLPELKGKRLGCWCGVWRPGGPDLHCHAVVLARAAEGETD